MAPDSRGPSDLPAGRQLTPGEEAGESHAGRLGRGPAGHSCNAGSLGVIGHMLPELQAIARKGQQAPLSLGKDSSF